MIDEDDDEDDEGKPISPSNRARRSAETDRNHRRRRSQYSGPEFNLHSSETLIGSKRSNNTGADDLKRIGSLNAMAESDGFLDDFFDTQIDKTTKFNNEIRSVIKNLGEKISNNASVILNESLEDEDK